MSVLLDFNYRKSPLKYFSVNLFYFGIALLFALLINRASSAAKARFNLSLWPTIMFQILLNILLMYVIEMHISTEFALDWQETTPGIVFTSVLFGSQILLLNNLTNFVSSMEVHQK